MNNELSLLGIATKAGKTVSGESLCLEAIRGNKAKLVIVAGDASDNTKKKFIDKCSYYNVKMIINSDKETLGRFCSKEVRTVVAVTDEGLAESIWKKIGGQ